MDILFYKLMQRVIDRMNGKNAITGRSGLLLLVGFIALGTLDACQMAELKSMKSEMMSLRSELRSEVSRLDGRIENLYGEIKAEIAELRLEIKELGIKMQLGFAQAAEKRAALRAEFKAETADLRAELNTLKSRKQ